MGDATKATVEKGEYVLTRVVDNMARIINKHIK
jgi:creatinine amidohydrolase/Fe(II)-dependent formamide hydrolase-like protein